MLAGRARRGFRLAVAAGAAAALPLLSAPSALAAPSAQADGIRDSQQWVLDMLDVQSAWMDASGKGVTVAVIDSGVSPNVSDLSGSVTMGPDLTGLHTSPANPHWGEHGTWMASIIAGHGHDGGSGIIGVAPDARILSIRVIPDRDDPGYATYDSEPEQVIQQSLATGIMTAVKDGARVISMSIGYSAPSGVVRAAVQYAYQHGVVLVASSGNSGQNDESRDHGFSPVSFPAEYPGVIGVGAVNRDGSAAGFSSDNLSVRVAAPGQMVPAQGRDGLYWTVDGTSPACALVAGVAALIVSRYPVITPAQVTEALTATAGSGKSGYNVRTGFGVVDAGAALRAAGRLVAAHGGASPEAATAHFGGGAAALPAPPVSPRGVGELVLFSVLALASLALVLTAGAGMAMLRRARGMHAGPPAPGYPPGPGYPPAASSGRWPGARHGYGGRPGAGYTLPGPDYGPADDPA
jgi:subtilisin family serine protease